MSQPPPWQRSYSCRACGADHEPDVSRWRCECGGVLDLVGGQPTFSLDAARSARHGLWRWASALPFAPDAAEPLQVTMGEGSAPLVTAPLGDCPVVATMEFASPTLSFKDRGAAVLVATALRLGARRLVADSSGNAGTAFAAYAARAGLPCDVFVPAAASPSKLAQARAHGAHVHAVDGDRAEVADRAVAHVEGSGAFYASHVWNPFFHEGTKTWAFDVVLALGRSPDVVVLPVGNGTLLLGAARGFQELLEAGVVDRVPRIVAVQAAACAPIADAFAAGAEEVTAVTDRGTVAEGIAIAAPPRGTQCLQAIRSTGGTVVRVTDRQIAAARAELAAHGLFVEPTAAAPAAAVRVAGLDAADGTVVLPLCGAGIKSG